MILNGNEFPLDLVEWQNISECALSLSIFYHINALKCGRSQKVESGDEVFDELMFI